MSLAKREKAARPAVRGPLCAVRAAFELLDQKDADALHRLIYDRLDLSANEVAAVLAEEDKERREAGREPMRIADHIVGRHRRNQCVNCQKG